MRGLWPVTCMGDASHLAHYVWAHVTEASPNLGLPPAFRCLARIPTASPPSLLRASPLVQIGQRITCRGRPWPIRMSHRGR